MLNNRDARVVALTQGFVALDPRHTCGLSNESNERGNFHIENGLDAGVSSFTFFVGFEASFERSIVSSSAIICFVFYEVTFLRKICLKQNVSFT
jgi:hypothetical protein